MERLDARVVVVWLWRVLVFAVVLAGAAGIGSGVLDVGVSSAAAAVAVFGVVALLGATHALLRYRIWRFDVREDTLYIEHGVLVRVRTTVPYVRVQHVDSRRGPLERVLGLGRVVVYTAGSRGADVTIPGLSRERAADAQETLRALAIESEPESGEGDAV
ncbi:MULTISPECIES: PH domain-containing protein [Halobacterium]|uniref:PH domain-containing protein n=1 Tax=Halobacterium TaxID=2239 RepID=UPI001965EDAC|nr:MULTISPECIES: PH domain-containing protein [Halobacterium]MDL0122196.1 PH domain-containing protein [Halobacterium salinarum]QRY25814.1 PH domain-containing protein [Halobacterium sp. BOL4-2]